MQISGNSFQHQTLNRRKPAFKGNGDGNSQSPKNIIVGGKQYAAVPKNQKVWNILTWSLVAVTVAETLALIFRRKTNAYPKLD